MITLYTIGFTKKSAEQFFELLRKNHVKQLVDVRISNNSQLAGFAKGRDLEYLAEKICGIKYKHITDFAPTKELLDDYHDGKVTWEKYIISYNRLLETRDIAGHYNILDLDGACFLCSEATPEQCHRRLLAEYFKRVDPEKVQIKHLVA